MESPLDDGTTGEIRRQLGATQAALTQLEAVLAPIPAADQQPTPRRGGGEG